METSTIRDIIEMMRRIGNSFSKAIADKANKELETLMFDFDAVKNEAGFLKLRSDELQKSAKELLDCFVVDSETGWWKPNPLSPMSQRDNALTKITELLK